MDLRQLERLPIEPDMCVGLTTGELKKIVGECDGIRFEIGRAQGDGTASCRFRGSLRRYANGGAANVGAFGYAETCDAVAALCARFGIDPRNALLENVEFGLDYPLPIPAKQFVKTLICHGSKPFQPLNIEKPDLGKVAPRQEYDLKIYDKGSQSDTGDANLLRVEIRVGKMAFLKRQGVALATLADLTDPDKVRPLGTLIQSIFADVVCYDGSVSAHTLTVREQLHLKEVSNPKWWADLPKRSRWDYRQKFALWAEKHGANKLFLNVVFSMPSHWEKLLSVTHQTLDFLSSENADVARGKLDFLSRKMRGQKVQLDKDLIYLADAEKKSDENPSDTPTQTPGDKRSFFHIIFCRCCGRDISAQRPGSRYCSERRFGPSARRCRDKAHNARRRAARRAEVERLESLLPGLPADLLSFTVYAPDRSAPGVPAMQAVATLTHAQVFGQPFPDIRQAVRVDVFTASGNCYALARSFAKRLLRHLVATPPAQEPPPVPKAWPLRPPPIVRPDAPLPPPVKGQRIGMALLGDIAEKLFENLLND